ncbi:MAG TPA: DUF4412 domain-containing protein [Gammaproteobacteria bacterium]|nr:DUF4412 domain-containing protein [Gammaproteobacteria bacterium]
MRFSLLLISAFLFTSSALADTTLTYKNSAGEPVMLYYLTSSQIRSEDHSENMVIIYDAKAGTQVILYPDSREYAVLSADAFNQQVSGPLAEFQKTMESIPPEQRAMMKNMMGAMLEQFKPTVTKGEHTSVAGYDCQKVSITIGNKVSSKMCLADPADLGISAAEYGTLNQLMDDMQEMVNKMLSGLGIDLSALTELDGVPVSITEGGSTKVLSSISHEELDADLFTVPDGYTQKSLTQAGQ